MIFVHGLGGDYAATWRHDQNASWPHWLAEDFPNVGVWSLEYAASPSKWARVRGWFTGNRDAGYSMPLPDRAGQVLDLMVQNGFGERPLLFICHSLGGLLVKQILRKADDAVDPRKKQVAEQTRAVLFLATPHAGAGLASLADTFPTLLGSTVSVKDLRVDDSHLRDLDGWYRTRSAGLGIQTATYFEQRGVKGLLPIVGPTSARPGIGADPVGLDEDHLSIAKPRERDAQVCGAARALLRNYVLARRSVPDVQPRSSDNPIAGTPRVPCELPPAAEKHFGRQTELKQLIDRLRAGKNSAVVGPAGHGKTALAAEAVRAVVGDSLAASPFPHGVVLLDLYVHQGKAEPAWNYLANALAGPGFMDSSPARERATEASRSLQVLIVIEGGEEADGKDARTTIPELCAVFSPENRRLLLTRLSTQANPVESVELKEALHPDDAANLLDSLTNGKVTGAVRDQALALVEGHPLALTWAGNLLARDDDGPAQLVSEWQAGELPTLSDPTRAEHTLEWLFNRSVRGLDDTAQLLLAAAGLLARAPFPLAAMVAVLQDGPQNIAIVRISLKSLVQRGVLRRSDEPDHWQFTHVLGYRFARREMDSDSALRDRLASWMRAYVEATIANSDHLGPGSLTRALEHAAALLRADADQHLWLPLAQDFLHEISVRLTSLGRLDLVALSLEAVANWLTLFPDAKAREAYWLRERAALIDRRGDVLRDQGDLAGALTTYRDSVTVMRGLVETVPSNTGWRRDLSVSHNKVGDVLRNQGDLDGALAAYTEALAERRRVAETHPQNIQSQWDLTVTQNRIGDVLRDRDDLAQALAVYQETLAIRRHLVANNPSNLGWQADLAASYDRIGTVLRRQGDLAGALRSYRKALRRFRRLLDTDPSNTHWQRDLSVSHNKVGNVLRNQGNLLGALSGYIDALAVMRRLAEGDPLNAGWQRDLSFSLTLVAQLYEQQGNQAEALSLAEESLEIDERLAALDRTNTIWQKDVAVSRVLVARLRN